TTLLGYFASKTFIFDAAISEFETVRSPLEALFGRTFKRTLWYVLGFECLVTLAPQLVQGPAIGIAAAASKWVAIPLFLAMTMFNAYIAARLELAIPII